MPRRTSATDNRSRGPGSSAPHAREPPAKNLFVVLLIVDPSSQELGPSTIPGRFNASICTSCQSAVPRARLGSDPGQRSRNLIQNNAAARRGGRWGI